jgi:hypothetical protein
MIEQKLIIGRYIDLTLPPASVVGPSAPGFQQQTPLMVHLAESHYSAAPFTPNSYPVGFTPSFSDKLKLGLQNTGGQIKSQLEQQRTSALGVGHVAKAHRNFSWLAWYPGLVNEIPFAGIDILTGPMSGCWITSYLRAGVHYIGHVGTEDDPNTAASIAAKNAWNTWAASVPPTQFSGFEPAGDWIGAPPPMQAGETRNKTFGLVTTTGEFYILFTYQVGPGPRLRIAGLQKTTSSLPVNGQIP